MNNAGPTIHMRPSTRQSRAVLCERGLCAGGLLAAALWLLCAGVAAASTPVSGQISQNTQWTVAGSPYLLSGQVTITNGAQLTIDPGALIQMQAGAGLEVVSGSLSASGNAGNPIEITSLNDVSGSATAPAKGDWGSISFDAGSIDANTTLDHVNVRYGHGIVITDASPTLRYVDLQYNAGAAITVDLQSSPLGKGLAASHNDLNGIAVPAGEMDADVVWSLVGIPYVIQQGTVAVGRRVFSLSPTYLRLANGATASLELDIPDAAPAGGVMVDVVSSVPSVVSTPASVMIAEGSQTAAVSVTATSLGSSSITASHSGFGTASATIDVVPSPALLLTPQSAVVSLGKSVDLTTSLSAVAQAGGVHVALANGNPALISLPSEVLVPAGQKLATFAVQGLALGSTTVSADAADFGTSTASITVRPVSLDLPPAMLVAPGSTLTTSLTLSDPAPTGGLSVQLSSADTAIATVPATLNVRAGTSAISFNVSGIAQGATTLSATASGYAAASSTVTVNTIKILISPSGNLSLPQNISKTLHVNLDKPAPAGGVVVQLATADPAVAALKPSSVTVPVGQTAATQSVMLTGIATGSTQLAMQAPGLSSASATVQVSEPVRLVMSPASVVVGKGLDSYYGRCYVALYTGSARYSPPEPLLVALTSSDPDKVVVPATVTIPAGQSYVYFSVSGVDLSTVPVTINATASGYASPAQLPEISVVTPQIVFGGLAGDRSPSGGRDDFYLSWYVPGATYASSQTSTTAETVALSIAAAKPAGIVAGFHDAATAGNAVTQVVFAAGRNNTSYAYRYVDAPTAAGTYQVQASIAGLGSWTSATQTVSSPTLKFARATQIVGKGLSSYYREQSVGVYANGQAINLAAPLEVTLTSSDPDKVAVPTTVTIPAGQSYVYFSVSGVDLSTAPVTINATASGYVSPAQLPEISVVTPQIVFGGLAGDRSPSGGRDDFYLSWYVPGATYASSQTSTTAETVALSIAAAKPAGIVAGFHDAATAGNAVTQVVFAAGRYDTSYAYRYVDAPTAAGTYQVQASIAGLGSWTSATQTVSSPTLKFARATLAVGKGLSSYYREQSVGVYANGQAINLAAPLEVTLTSSDPDKVAVPTTVTIPAGQSYVYFSVSGVDLSTAPVTINATASGYVSPAQLPEISVVTPQIVFHNLAGDRSPSGGRDDFYLSWYVPGATYASSQTSTTAETVALSIAAAKPAGIVAGFHDAATAGNAVTQVVFAAGRNNTSYAYRYVDAPTAAGTYQVQASIAGLGSWTSATQTVSRPTLAFSSRAVVGGLGLATYPRDVTITQRVNGQAFNAVSAVDISLACVASGVCSTPAKVTIPAGSSSVHVSIHGLGLGATQVVMSAAGYAVANSLPVSVIKPSLRYGSVPSTLSPGQTGNFTVYLHVPGDYYSDNQSAIDDMTLDLTSASPGVASVPATTSITAGHNYSAGSTLTAIAAGTTTITASGANVKPVTSYTVTVQ